MDRTLADAANAKDIEILAGLIARLTPDEARVLRRIVDAAGTTVGAQCLTPPG